MASKNKTTNLSPSWVKAVESSIDMPKSGHSKTKVDSLSGKSDKYIAAKDNEWKRVVSIDAQKISNAQKTYDAQKPAINAYEDLLNKENGYRSTKEAYDVQAKKIADDKKKLAKTKKSADKKKLESDIKSTAKVKKELAKKITEIENKAGYKKQKAAAEKAKHIQASAKKVISSKRKLKAADKKKAAKYHAENLKRKAKTNKKLQKENAAKINKKIDAAKKIYQGQTAVYRADFKTSRVYMLAEMQPQESISIDMNTNPKDNADTRTSYTVENSKELSGTYYLYGKSWADRDAQYRILQGWARKGVEVAVRGFSKLAHCYLESVGKSSETGLKNVLALQLTFKYSMKYPIEYAKTKKKSKSLGKTVTKRGIETTHKVVKVKSGTTLLEIARQKGVKYSEIKKLNKKLGDLSLKPGQEVRFE